MIIREYVAETLNEAMTKAKFELGNNIIIVSQKKTKKPGFWGLFSKKTIKITVAVENEDKNQEKAVLEEQQKEFNDKNLVSEDEEFKKSIESIKKIMEKENLVSDVPLKNHNQDKHSSIEERISEHNKKVNESPKEDLSDVKQEVSELKDLINKVIENTSKTNNKTISDSDNDNDELINKLNELDIDKCFYKSIIDEVNNNSNINEDEALRDIFERDILISSKELKGRVVLVGPTGVGKTTTIAKLAGRLALVDKKNIGLITVDTYRIGAIEQLKTYAEIMNIPFCVVITAKEMESAIESMKDCDVILIDTTGRSSKNTMQISELRTFIEKVQPDIVNMVVSATTKNKDIKTILEGYSGLNYNNIIITKLDETISYGCLYNISRLSNKPISFITVGQNVPDDIRIPTKEDIARFILREETLC